MILAISDKRVQRAVRARTRELDHDPELQGKPLAGTLQDFYRIKVLDRYRLVYTLREDRVTLYAVATGIRNEGDKRHIYPLAKRLVNLAMLEPDNDADQGQP